MEELILFLMTFLVVFFAILLVAYILQGIVYMKLAKKCNVNNPWAAWVPYGVYYVSASIAGLTPFMWLIPIGLVIVIFSELNPLLTLIVAIALLIYIIWVDRLIMEKFEKNPNLALLHLIPIIGSTVVFIIFAALAFGESMPKAIEDGVIDAEYKEL